MYNKTFSYFILSVFAFIYIFSAKVFANVSIDSIVTQNTITSPYTTQCDSTYRYAIYEWQSFHLYHTHTPSNLSSTREYFSPSRVLSYNYANVIGNSISWNNIWWKFTDFKYRSNWRLWTSKFNNIWWWIQTTLAWKEDFNNRVVKPNPNPNRASLVWQIVHILNRKQVQSRWWSSFAMTTHNFNTNNIYTQNANPNAYYDVVEDKKCQNFYVAKCWDWVRDDVNKSWWPNTNWKQWIQTNDWFVDRIFPSTVTTEQCDGTDWVTPGYTCNAQCELVALPPQMADLSVTKIVNNPTPTIWSNVIFTMVLSNAWPANAGGVTLKDLLPSWYTYVSSWTSQWTYNSTNWIWNVWTININTTKTLTITAQVKSTWSYTNTIEVTASDKPDPDSTPNNHNPYEDDQASATVTPQAPTPAPTCTLTVNPSNIVSGWLASVNWSISWSFVVPTYIYVSPQILWAWPHTVNTPTWTTYAAPNQNWVYTFTMTVMNINWQQNTCSATLNVWTPPPNNPVLTIQKTLLENKLYYSWDKVWFKINFQNTWSWTANNVVLTDILPSSLNYLTSTISGVPNSNLGFAMSWANTVVTYSWFDLAAWAAWYMIITWVLNTNNPLAQKINYSDIQASNHAIVYSIAAFQIWEIPNNTVTFTKSSTKSEFQLWEDIQFTITATNHWPAPISNLTITDIRPSPSCINYLNRSSSNWFIQSGSMNRYIPWTIASWQTVTLVLNWKISSNVACALWYINTANLTYTVFGQTQTQTASFPFTVLVWYQCDSLTPINWTVIIIDDNNDAKAKFKCDTVNWVQWNISINCWNGQILNGYGSTYTATCNYGNNLWTYNVRCYVEWNTSDNCAETIIVDEWMLGYCGNWIIDWIEKCDLKTNNAIIHDYLDFYELFPAGNYANDGYRCSNCAIKKQWFYYEPPACNGISTTLSVQKWEVLPLRWELEWNNIVDENDCEDADDWDILEDSLKCTFKIFNWNDNQQYDGQPSFITTKRCNLDEWNWREMFKYFEDLRFTIFPSLQNAFGKYYFKVNDFLDTDTYGEYKLVLDKVEYDYCDGDDQENWTEVDRICEVNFAVTKPYLMQKSLFGVTPKATTDINLDQFYDMAWQKIINKTDLYSIMKVDADDYDGWVKIDKQIDDFINKYDKLSAPVPINSISNIADWTITKAKKLPGKQIYIIQWNGKLTLKQLNYFTKPFTMIILWMDVIIEWSLKTNWMFVVKWWKISFKEDTANPCQFTQVVQWIFISKDWFGVWDTTLNIINDLDKPRCNRWWLTVKWVLIWDGIDTLVKQRRSQLNDRFLVNSNNENRIKIERRNKIFNWASLMIEYSPWLRSNLPPWAEDFTKQLEVYKR